MESDSGAGALTAKAVLRMGVRELDLVQEYTGHPYDMVLGIYYAKARMYDPANSRWLSPDPVKGNIANPQSLNLYPYVLNNPILYIDSTGLVPVIVKYVVGKHSGMVGYDPILNIVTVWMNNKKWIYLEYEIINGHVILDSEILAKDFNIPEKMLRHDTYDAFNSVDDAALAFVLMMMPKTLQNGLEYGSNILSAWHDGREYFYFNTFACGGHYNVLWNVVSGYKGGDERHSVGVKIGAQTYRLYESVSVSFVHTHPWCTRHGRNEGFSTPDMWLVDSGIIQSIYVGTSRGNLLKYNATIGISTVVTGLPIASQQWSPEMYIRRADQ